MQFFLKWKSWQIFLFTVALPFGFQFFLMKTLISSEANHELMFTFMPLVTLVFMALYLLWFWSLGTELNKLAPETSRPSSFRFKFGLIFTGIYISLFHLSFIFNVNGGGFGFGVAMPVIFILHLTAMYFMFYGIYFISKNLVLCENESTGEAKSSKGTFFLMWFFPLGIWFVQPRINKVYAARNT